MNSCFFIGHRERGEDVFPALVRAVETHIVDYGVTEFIVGHYGEFDWMAARAVILAKEKYPDILLFVLIPYHPAERPVPLSPGFDNSFYPPGMERVPKRFAIPRANGHMIDTVTHLIACVWHPASNARDLVTYAQRKGVKVTNVSVR